MAILDNTSLAYMNKRNRGNPVLNQYFATSGNQLTPEALQGMVQGELDARYANQQQQKELQLRREQLEYQKQSDQRTYDMQRDAIKSARNMGIISNLVGAGTAIAGNWDKIKDTTVGRGISSVGGALETGAGAIGDVLKSGYNTLTGAPTSSKLAPMPSGALNTEGLLSYPQETGPKLNPGNMNFSIAGDGRPPLPTSLNLEKNPMMQYYGDQLGAVGSQGSLKQSVFGQKNASPSQPIIAQKTPDTVMAIENLSPVETPATVATQQPYTSLESAGRGEIKKNMEGFKDMSVLGNKSIWDNSIGKYWDNFNHNTRVQQEQNTQKLAKINSILQSGKVPDMNLLDKEFPMAGTGVFGITKRIRGM